VTERDLELLTFVADHRLVLAAHAQAFLGVSAAAASARLRALSRAGYLTQNTVFHRQPACYQVMRKGLALIDSHLPSPRIDLRCYEHDVGVAWLWLAARNGTWGQMNEVISEREMRSRDATRKGTADPLGVRLGGVGARGRERLHYPDLLLVTEDGRRIALELELSRKGETRREKILSGYGADPRVDAVLYLVDKPGVARSVITSARRLGISSRVHVQPVRWSGSASRAGAAIEAQRARRSQRGGIEAVR
jgi:hypothetical protein